AISADSSKLVARVADRLYVVVRQTRGNRVSRTDDRILKRKCFEQRAFYNFFRDHVAEKASRAFAIVIAKSVMRKSRCEKSSRIRLQYRVLRQRFHTSGHQASA